MGFRTPKFRLGVSILCLRPSSKQLSRRTAALLEFFRPQNCVFTPHFLREITSVLGVYGVNRNLLIEICPKPHSNRCESTGQPSNRSVTEFFFFFLTFRFTRGVAPDPPCPPSGEVVQSRGRSCSGGEHAGGQELFTCIRIHSRTKYTY